MNKGMWVCSKNKPQYEINSYFIILLLAHFTAQKKLW